MNQKNNIMMPQGIGLWLKRHTELTNEQIMAFCNLDKYTLLSLENNAIEADPLSIGHLTIEEIKKGEADTRYILKDQLPSNCFVNGKQNKYISISQKAKNAGIIAWLFKHHPNMNFKAVASLLGTTTVYIQKIIKQVCDGVNITPINPLTSEIFSKSEIDSILNKM